MVNGNDNWKLYIIIDNNLKIIDGKINNDKMLQMSERINKGKRLNHSLSWKIILWNKMSGNLQD